MYSLVGPPLTLRISDRCGDRPQQSRPFHVALIEQQIGALCPQGACILTAPVDQQLRGPIDVEKIIAQMADCPPHARAK
jgi:hypothetical protein